MGRFENFCQKILSSKLFQYLCLIWGPGKFKKGFTTQECKYDRNNFAVSWRCAAAVAEAKFFSKLSKKIFQNFQKINYKLVLSLDIAEDVLFSQDSFEDKQNFANSFGLHSSVPER